MRLKIIVGLGNPGLEYQKTRHNLGFEIIEALATSLNLSFTKKKFGGLYCHGEYKNCKFLLLQPLTFMNNSGQCVKEFADYFQVLLEDVLVIYDDLDLPLGTFRYRLQGSSGGHNGIKSIINSWQMEKIKRLRVGIGSDKKIL
jgi:PTH1 family peptidyl-tRNA hydrolase